MKLVEYNPLCLEEFIMENKDHILSTIQTCIKQHTMNLMLLGHVPKQIIGLIIQKYYRVTFDENPPNGSILEVDCFKDLNLGSSNNDIILFSKSQTNHKKFVVIYNLEQVPENVQVYFKHIMHKNTFFIFCSECQQKVYETLLTRCILIDFLPLTYGPFKQLLLLLGKQENITIEDPDEIIQQTNMNPDYILNLLNYTKLMKKTSLPKGNQYLQIIKDVQLERYFEYIQQKKIKEAFTILFDYYDKGFSILDIYYFLFEYAKHKLPNPVNYKIIQLLCEYINDIYEGQDHKIGLVFFTNDIICRNIYVV